MATSIDQQFIEYIVKSLVGKPDAVSIERRIDEKGVLLELSVDPEDLGRVIGKRGATAQSLRTLLRALGTKNDARYNLKIIDTGPPGDRKPSTDDKPKDEKPTDDKSTDDKPKKDDNKMVAKAKPADDSAANDSAKTDDASTDKPADDDEEIVIDEEGELTVPAPTSSHSDLASRTRAELADLDDLDV